MGFDIFQGDSDIEESSSDEYGGEEHFGKAPYLLMPVAEELDEKEDRFNVVSGDEEDSQKTPHWN